MKRVAFEEPILSHLFPIQPIENAPVAVLRPSQARQCKFTLTRQLPYCAQARPVNVNLPILTQISGTGAPLRRNLNLGAQAVRPRRSAPWAKCARTKRSFLVHAIYRHFPAEFGGAVHGRAAETSRSRNG